MYMTKYMTKTIGGDNPGGIIWGGILRGGGNNLGGNCPRPIYTMLFSPDVYLHLTLLFRSLAYVFFYVTLTKKKKKSTNVFFSIHLFETIALFHNSFILIYVAMSDMFFYNGNTRR